MMEKIVRQVPCELNFELDFLILLMSLRLISVCSPFEFLLRRIVRFPFRWLEVMVVICEYLRVATLQPLPCNSYFLANLLLIRLIDFCKISWVASNSFFEEIAVRSVLNLLYENPVNTCTAFATLILD